MSLKYRIACTITILATCLIVVVFGFGVVHSLSGVRGQITQSNQVRADVYTGLARQALLRGDFAAVHELVVMLRRDPRINELILTDRQGTVMAASRRELIGRSKAELPIDAPGWRQIAIADQAVPLGVLAIHFSYQSLNQAYLGTVKLGVAIAAVGVVLIVLASLALGHVLTRRLQDLADAADRVAAGDLSLRLDVDGRDEVARVGRAFNSMIGRLAEHMGSLRAARDRLLQPTEAMSEGFALWDAQDRLTVYNRKFTEIFAAFSDQIRPGMHFSQLAQLLHREFVDKLDNAPQLEVWIRDRLARQCCADIVRMAKLHEQCWLSINEFRTGNGEMVGIYTDVTERRERQIALEQSEQRMHAIMNSVIDGIIALTPDGFVESCNEAAATIFGYDVDGLIGMGIADLLADPAQAAGGGAPLLSLAHFGRLPLHSRIDMQGRRRDGTEFPVEISIAKADLQGSPTSIVTVRDITESKAAEEIVLYHATHDALTGLPNRARFDERLAEALRTGMRSGEILAVAFVDIDRFKLINDSLGHGLGDAVLVAIGRRLQDSLRAEDTVSRLGGDEFILLLRELQDGEDAARILQRAMDAVRLPLHVHGQELHVTISAGISLFPADAQSPEQLLKAADIALYRAKESGRDRLQLFTPSMNTAVFEQLILEGQFRRALEQQQFVLVYQPQIDIASGKVIGVEALVRWQHAELGLLPPSQFVPIAERSGWINPLGQWVLHQACEHHREWRERGLPPLRLAVNMSAHQFRQSGLAQQIREVLDETGMEIGCLELELTESILMQEGDDTAELLEALSRIGINLALDDFGTGYSSLSYLKRFPIKRVKIDRSFVRDINFCDNDATLARAIVMLAHGLGMEVVAEGVETMEQLALLRRFGCDEAQGFLLGRPVLAADIPALVARRNSPLRHQLLAVETGAK